RVQTGDPLYGGKKYSVLSPVTGVASALADDTLGISLRIDGEIRKKVTFENRILDESDLSARIISSGLFSLDFPNLPLMELFQKFKGEKNSLIVFSPFTKDNLIDFAALTVKEYPEAFALLKNTLKEVYPDSEICDYISGNRIKFKYPLGDPTYFLSRKNSKFRPGMTSHESVLYIGPETLYHLLRVLYYSIPFLCRHISILTVDKSGWITSGVRNFLLRNGQNLSFLTSFYRKKFPYFTVNSLYDKNDYYGTDAPFYIDIYRHYSIVYFSVKPGSGRELSCVDCGDCSIYCPVSANPHALVDGQSEKFNSDICIECGICTVFCPSRINFRERIQSIRNPVKNIGE
ncbi:MAG: hypothetical protein K8R21_09000, partial [Leptospira sp.]|nr:hypothetical protein [Leptospira sp.]